MLTPEDFVQRVQERAGLSSPEEATAAIEITLAVLGEGLSHDEAGAVAEALPAPFAEPLRRAHFTAAHEPGTFYARITAREGAPPGMAIEHAQVVCQEVGEAITAETRDRLERALPAPLAALFQPRPIPAAAPPRPTPAPAVAPGAGHTLADGRPGSLTPLSEAEAGRPQSRSPAEGEDPRAPYKLSSGRPRSNEGHRIADGAPGSDHPVSDSD
ncbi:DUF2267 domain-containing protein [Haliangium sp.]|uniref:DUF2267 domain-containing protein n=1 Tax=Haliangium sp. TaxID=2663208 RepID=UPI003D0BD135